MHWHHCEKKLQKFKKQGRVNDSITVSIMNMDKEYLLHKYLNGTASPEEIKILSADPQYLSYLKIAKTTLGFETPSFKKEDNFETITSQIRNTPKVKQLHPRRKLMGFAAAILILLVGYLFIQGFETTITTQIAEKKDFLLPDASQVQLNSQSAISFHKKKWNQNRSLQLKGEAFFKVTKGSTFSVHTPQGVVQVLGTQFNVFSRDSLFNIKCYEGLVSVVYKDSTIQVPAGIMLDIRSKNNIKKSKIVTFTPNWIANESTFENVSLSLVLEELQRQYPIKIISQIIVNKKFTGSFTHTDLSIALRSICDPLQVNFIIKGEEVTLYAKKNN